MIYLKLNQASDSEKLDGLNTHIYLKYMNLKIINLYQSLKIKRARLQPLLIYITTAGFQLNGPLVDMVEAGKDTLNGIIEDERTFIT